MKLAIGDKTYSSWSLRPWLALKRAGLPFEEVLIRLRRPDTAARIAEISPTARVPVLLLDDGTAIPDSLAICEWAAEQRPDAGLWPADPTARALARAAACEMHAGFAAVRGEFSMDLKLRTTKAPSPAAAAELRRLVALWSDLRARFGRGGPFLFGDYGIVDAFFAPVATRARSYGVDLAAHGDRGEAAAYVEALLAWPDFLDWERGALEE